MAAFNAQITSAAARSGPIVDGLTAALTSLAATGFPNWNFAQMDLPEAQRQVSRLRTVANGANYALTQLQTLNDQLVAFGNRGNISNQQAMDVAAIADNPMGMPLPGP
jgi:hypothetical protein